jgi:8-oxo-dGTP diphosphatase
MKIRQIYWHADTSECIKEDSYVFCPMCGKSLVLQTVGNIHRRTCPDCGYVHFRNPSPTISLLITDHDRILLGKRRGDFDPNSWATPSGYIEYGEDFITSARREAKEETGLEIEITAILNVTDSYFSSGHHYLNIYLHGQVLDGQLGAYDDMSEFCWFPIGGPLPKMVFQEDIDMIQLLRLVKSKFLPVEKFHAHT